MADGYLFFSQLIFTAAVVLLSVGYFRHKWQQRRIRQWKKSLALTEHQHVFDTLYQGINGFILSRKARSKEDALDYIYGEIDMLPFIALLSLVKPDKNTVFYDLGSGTGKAVIACAMVYPVHKSVGVELLAELHHSACQQNKKLADLAYYAPIAKKINFIKGNFLAVNLSDANLIFINSTSIFGSTWEQLCSVINQLPQEVTVITTSKPLLSKKFLPVISTKIQMSWGVVPAYIHKQKTNLH